MLACDWNLPIHMLFCCKKNNKAGSPGFRADIGGVENKSPKNNSTVADSELITDMDRIDDR